MKATSIEWTDATWNPVEGCTMAKGSEAGGCLNCYAARAALRRPASGLSIMRPSGPRWTGKVGLVERRLTDPLHWRKPQRIFVNSMSDLFHEALPDKAIDRVFAVMALCPQHTFQVLTKRPERMLQWMSDIPTWPTEVTRETTAGEFASDHTKRIELTGGSIMGIKGPACLPFWPLPNVHLGVSVEDQKTADARIPLLLQTPAAKRFISYEPALAAVDFTRICLLPQTHGSHRAGVHVDALHGTYVESGMVYKGDWDVDGPSPPDSERQRLDQIIIGGESGPGARPFDIEWARNTIEQCKAAGVACFVKQLGAVPIFPEPAWRALADAGQRVPLLTPKTEHLPIAGYVQLALKDRKGGDMSEWPDDLRVREYPRV
ncbi:MAG TPA: DUF5131 family protein [Bryobacteraceae bacterium]|nr:DUF5131 family protein [Bryobacteraceae bacterium]